MRLRQNFFKLFGMEEEEKGWAEQAIEDEKAIKEAIETPEEETRKPGILDHKPDLTEQKPYLVSLPGNIEDGGKFNPNSPTWAFIRTHCEEKLDKLREKNDKLSLSMEKTSFLRGEISTLKQILEIPEKVINMK
jgi:hypothetical protein